MRIAVIDSGVHRSHPHIGGVAGGVSIAEDGCESADYVDRIGHGTAVTAVIREKAPDAEIFAVRVFHTRLATRIDTLLRAIEWSVENGMHLINLSLGTSNPDHAPALLSAVERVTSRGITLVAAHEDGGTRWLPGCLPTAPLPDSQPIVGQAVSPVSSQVESDGAVPAVDGRNRLSHGAPAGLVPVAVDWDCPRDEYRTAQLPDGRTLFRASGYPRPIPGVPPERNLKGISFAVANVSGLLAAVTLGSSVHTRR